MEPARFDPWQPAVQEYLDDFAEGRFDEHGYPYLAPLADVAAEESEGALIIGHAGEGVTRFALRQGAPGIWSHNAIDDDWTWRAPDLATFWRGWCAGTIAV